MLPFMLTVLHLYFFLVLSRKDTCFRALETLLSEALPILVHKSHLLVLAANFCTLGLMIGRLRSTQSGKKRTNVLNVYM